MGLDVVELLMNVEDAFDILLGDDEASEVRTAGDLHRLVVAKLRQRDADPCLSARLFHRIRDEIIARLGVPRSAVRPSTRLESLIPRGHRRAIWRAVAPEGQLPPPALDYPRWLRRALFGLLVATPLVAVASVFCLGIPWPTVPIAALVISLAWAAGCLVLAILTQPLAVCLPNGCESVADMVRRMAPRGYGAAKSPPAPWTEDEVWSRLQAVIASTLQVDPARVTKDADIVRDLGAG